MGDKYINPNGLQSIKDYIDNKKQDKLVSGENIKTIHEQSVLGEGDLTIPDANPIQSGVVKLTTSVDLDKWNNYEAGLALSPTTFKNLVNYMIAGADSYSSKKAYSVGDLVLCDSHIYKCITEVPSGGEEWNYRHWELLLPLRVLIEDKQDKLVSGTNVKTINGESLLGSGNLEVESADEEITQDDIDDMFGESSIYGVEWDGTSTTKWTRTDSAAMLSDPVPATGTGTGSSPFDNFMPWAGMIKVEDENAGSLVKIPKFYFRWTFENGHMKLQIADRLVSGFYVSPAHADRGDGKGERDFVYMGAYHSVEDTYKSTAGALPAIGETMNSFRTHIHNLGTNIFQMDYRMLVTIWMLYLVEFADWNSQAVIGNGCGNGSNMVVNGQCDGMNYHTGTNSDSKEDYGYIRYRYIEGLWDNVMTLYDGIYFDDLNIYVVNNPNNFSDNNGGVLVGQRNNTGWYISSWKHSDVTGYEWFIFPYETNGSGDTYTPDLFNNNVETNPQALLFGGADFGRNSYNGLFNLSATHSSSGSSIYIGARLQVLDLEQED